MAQIQNSRISGAVWPAVVGAGLGIAAAFVGVLRGRRRHQTENCNPGTAARREGEGEVRSAGPEGMRSKVKREWTVIDEASDESFPASDPPGKY